VPVSKDLFIAKTILVQLKRWFCVISGFQHYVSVDPYPYLRVPFQKYVRITFIR